ncbi:hypothetical protein [Tsuneonella mangrovi]|uniref:hypothetical protein n=1 Tax=Tsuneonella mangrovi TaxID=1982042 RepID=UPI000BA29F74|nr:hypothetical protein [Tsuneonella mangrovi]
MRTAWRLACSAAIILASLAQVAAFASPPHEPARTQPLAFRVDEGRNINAFVRDGPVAAHLLLRSGCDPRLIVAFPAGNSGVGIWFSRLARPAKWTLEAPPQPLTGADHEGRPLRGIVTLASIEVPELNLHGAVLSSVRVLRDYERTGDQPAGVVTGPHFGLRSVTWERDRLDGAPGYRLALEILDGTIDGERILAGPDGRIALRITALTGAAPLTPLAGTALLNQSAGQDPAARRTLEFLSYHEKFLAGSWRFNTYFGRDTLLSVRLLMPALRPQAIEAGLGSVLARLSPDGEVAHEEDIGEFAIIDHMRSDGTRSATPVYDYKMVDETLMLAPVAAHWLLDDARSSERAAAFLENTDSTGLINGAALVSNLVRVIDEGARFAADPRPANLVSLKPGVNVGNWRDSEIGLGGGRYPYDVNAVLMPAALDAVARLQASGQLDKWIDSQTRAKLREAGKMARIWHAQAPAIFAVSISHRKARLAVAAAAKEAGISPAAALRSLPNGPLRFQALALDAHGAPIAVLQSDVAFDLLFSDPRPSQIELILASILRPFPAGLMSDAGMLIANPAFAKADKRAEFTREDYHGEVIWSWQHALVLAGIEHQLARSNLPIATRHDLEAAHRQVTAVVDATRKWRNSELWSWNVLDGHLVPAAFGASDQDADESNAAQLWSTVYLGLAH